MQVVPLPIIVLLIVLVVYSVWVLSFRVPVICVVVTTSTMDSKRGHSTGNPYYFRACDMKKKIEPSVGFLYLKVEILYAILVGSSTSTSTAVLVGCTIQYSTFEHLKLLVHVHVSPGTAVLR